MKQKIYVLLFLTAVAGFPLTAAAGYIGGQDHWQGKSYFSDNDSGDWFGDFRHGKSKPGYVKHGNYSNDYFHDKDWDIFHGKAFDYRHIDLKWLHVDNRWFHILLEHFGWFFDGDYSGPKPGVPEPASLLLLATGVLLLAGLRRVR